MHPWLMAAGSAGLLALAAGGYLANEWRVCQGLQDDYVSTIERYAGSLKTRALTAAAGVRIEVDPKQREEQHALNLKLQEMMLSHINQRCGSDAGDAASSRARDVLQENMKDILSVP